MLDANPGLRIEIGGHTDNVGDEEANRIISEQRAQSVVDWLTQRGISTGRLIAKGYGSTRPLASNDDEANGRELNRRIEISVVE